jgi:hyperosmotically inducible protein
MKSLTAALLLAGAFAAAPARAQIEQRFHELDRNGDGVLTRDELARVPGMSSVFDVADDNHDGKLTPDEFIKAESLYRRQQAGDFLSDAELTAKVKTALLRERGLKSADVHVETSRGTVLLSGWVDSEEQHMKAVKVTQLVPGVKQVKDGLNVR